MRASRALVLLTALSMPFLAFTVPAQANQSLSGTITDTDPNITIYEPDWHGNAQSCATGSSSPTTAHADTVDYVAKSTGLRTVTVKTDPTQGEAVVYLYRNGTCVAADFEGDDAAETTAGIVDLVNVPINFGDNVRLVIASPLGAVPLSWSATITEPPSVTGKATHTTTGKAKKYVTFPKAVNCGNHHATVKLKKKAKNARWVVFKANTKKLKKVTKTKPGKKITLRHIPAKTTKLKVTVKLKSGKKLQASRSYYRCL